MGKHTTQQQFAMLVAFMEKYPDLGRGWVKTDNRAEHVDRLWEELTQDLNALGLPKRDVTGWKKVWSDYKVFIKKKLIQHKKEVDATGGGECNQLYLTPLEETVVRITAMEKAVHGIKNSKTFGVKEKNSFSVPLTSSINCNQRIKHQLQKRVETYHKSVHESFDSKNQENNGTIEMYDDLEITVCSPIYDSNTPKRSRYSVYTEKSRSPDKSSTQIAATTNESSPMDHNDSVPLESSQKSTSSKTHKMLEMQMEMNQRFHIEKMKKFDEIIKSNKDVNSSLKRSYRATEKMCDIQKNKNDLLKKQIENEAAHHLEKEQILNKNVEQNGAHQKRKRELLVQKIELKKKNALVGRGKISENVQRRLSCCFFYNTFKLFIFVMILVFLNSMYLVLKLSSK